MIQPVSNLSRTCKAVWNIFNQNGMRSNVIGWWPSHPAEPLNGVTVSDHFHRATGPIRDKSGTLFEMWPPLPAAVHPRELLKTLAELRFHPDELVQEMVTPFIPLVAEIDQAKDKRVAALLKILCECITIHSVATWLMDNKPWDFFGVYFDAIDHFCHGFMKYHPPRQAWIPERDFELYSGVVTQAYLLHDQMLGTLLQKGRAGHHCDSDVRPWLPSRPSAAPGDSRYSGGARHRTFRPGNFRHHGAWHPEGRVDLRRERSRHRAHSAGALRFTGGRRHGRPCSDVRVRTHLPSVETIPSWEDVPGEDGRHPEDTLLDPIAAREALEQMVALGYIEKPDDDGEEAVAATIRDLRCNLAESYQNGDRHEDAATIFRELYAAEPDEQRFAVRYFVSCQAMGRTNEMRRIVEDMEGRRRLVFEEATRRYKELFATANERLAARPKAEVESPEPDANASLEAMFTPEEKAEFEKCRKLRRYDPAVVDYLKSQVLTAEKRYEEALECLGRITASHTLRPGLLLRTGDLYRKLHRFREARATYRRALEIDPDNAHAYLGLCRIALTRRKYEAAAGHALDCLQRLYHYPVAHYLFAVALAGMEEYARAAREFPYGDLTKSQFPPGAPATGGTAGGKDGRSGGRAGASAGSPAYPPKHTCAHAPQGERGGL